MSKQMSKLTDRESSHLPSPSEPRYDLTKLNDDTVTACYIEEVRPSPEPLIDDGREA